MFLNFTQIQVMVDISSDSMCRLCLSTDDNLLLPVDTRISWKNQDYPLAFRIVVCVGTDILPDDGLPQKVCHRCLFKIDSFYDFKEICEANEKLLIARKSAIVGVQEQKYTLPCNGNIDDKNSEINISDVKRAPEEDDFHDMLVMYGSDDGEEQKPLKSPILSDIDIEETTLKVESDETNLNKVSATITLNEIDKGIVHKLTDKSLQSSPCKISTCAAPVTNSSEMLREEYKKSTTNNILETTVCVVTDSSEMSTEISKKLTVNNKVETVGPIIDTNVVMLPIERTYISDSSEISSEENKKSITDGILEAVLSDIDMFPIEDFNINNQSENSTEESKELTVNNRLQSPESDIDVSVLPIEITSLRNSSEILTEKIEMTAAINKLETKASVVITEENKKSTTDDILEAVQSDSDMLRIVGSNIKKHSEKCTEESEELTINNRVKSPESDTDFPVLSIKITSVTNSFTILTGKLKKSTAINKLEAEAKVVITDILKSPIQKAVVKYLPEILREKIKISAMNNSLKTPHTSLFPIEKTDLKNSSEILTDESNKPITSNEFQAVDSDVNANIFVLPIKKTEQSNFSGSRCTRNKKEKGIKLSKSKNGTRVISNDEQIPVKRRKKTKVKKVVGQNKTFLSDVNFSQSGNSQFSSKYDEFASSLEEDSDSLDVRKMESMLSCIADKGVPLPSSSNNRSCEIQSDLSQHCLLIDVEDAIRKQREQYKSKENAEKKVKNVASKKCSICDQILNSYEYKNHMDAHKIAEKGDRKYTCLECNKSFGAKYSLKRHMLIHNPVKPFQCSKCKCSFSDRSIFLKHEREHNIDKPFHCPFCLKAYTKNLDLLNHYRKYHKSESNKNNIQTPIEVPTTDHECYTKRVKKSHPRLKQEGRRKIITNNSEEYEDNEDDDDIDYFETFDLDFESEIIELGDDVEMDCPIEIKDDDDGGGVDNGNMIDISSDMDTDFSCEILSTHQELESHKNDKITCNICDKEFYSIDDLKGHYSLHFLFRSRKDD